MAGFLVPFLSGGLIKAQEIRDEYDENAGKFIDAANALYKDKFNKNQKAIELQNANYAAVKNSLGVPLAEIAAKQGLLGEVPTAKIVGYVQSQFSKSFIDNLDKRVKAVDDKGNPTFKLSDLGYQTLFSEDIKTARDSLTSQRKWAAKNLNRGAIKNVADLYLAGDEELPEPTGLEKAQSFMFGDRVTEGTGVVFDQAVAEKIGETVTVQPKEVKLEGTISERLGFKEPVNIGTVAEEDKAIANILNIKDIRLAEGGGIVFPERFRNEVLAIKEKAKDYALEFTTMKGGTEVVNVSGLMQKAHNELAMTIISPISVRFMGYTKDTSQIAASMNRRVMKAADINMDSDWVKDNNFTKDEFIKGKQSLYYGVNNQGNVQTQMVDAITVSQNVLNVMEKEIENLSSLSMQKLYVDYLPDNLSVNLDGTVTSAKDYFKSIFGLVSY